MKELESFGHELDNYSIGSSVVAGVASHEGMLHANSDFRKGGSVAGF